MGITPNQNNKKGPQLKSTQGDVELFEELPIPINLPDNTTIIVFMRLLKIKEINILNRIVYMQERDSNSQQAAVMLISLAASTLNIPSNEIPVEASSKLVKYMISLNFPDKNKTGNNKKKNKTINNESSKSNKQNKKEGLIECIDFLISNGHTYDSIMEYPVKVFDKFVTIAAERLGLKQKTTDPAEAFRKLGLPVKKRGSKE